MSAAISESPMFTKVHALDKLSRIQWKSLTDSLCFRNPPSSSSAKSRVIFNLGSHNRATFFNLDLENVMESTRLLDQIDTLIDSLLNDSKLSSSSLASMLMAARESVRDGYHVALARRIWDANNELRLRGGPDSI
jgi:hypothetical protein